MSKSPKYAQVTLSAQREREIVLRRQAEEQRRKQEALRQLAEQANLSDQRLKANSAIESAREVVRELRAAADSEGYDLDDATTLKCLAECERAWTAQRWVEVMTVAGAVEKSLAHNRHDFDDWRDRQQRRSVLVGTLYQALAEVGLFADPALIHNVPGPSSLDTVVVPAQRANGEVWDISIADDSDGADRISYSVRGVSPDGPAIRIRCPGIVATINEVHVSMHRSGVDFTQLTWDDDDLDGTGQAIALPADSRVERSSE